MIIDSLDCIVIMKKFFRMLHESLIKKKKVTLKAKKLKKKKVIRVNKKKV